MKTITNGLINRIIFVLIALFVIVMPLSQAAAMSTEEEEMKLLRMYFKEDELVVSPTRTLKKLSETAENIEVVHAKEIERMNAHTVAEVLERVTGMFVSLYSHDFGSDASIEMQGSTNKHVLVLVDSVPWNSWGEGAAILNSIPVGIIKRIEIIKGPASSSWGSSLGGVINIITKDAEADVLTGSLSASLGERDTSDLRTELAGDTPAFSYYLYAGRQESDGLRKGRWFDNETFYAKINVPVSPDVGLIFTAGYGEPRINDGYDDSAYDQIANSITRDFFGTVSLSALLSNSLSFDVSAYYHKFRFVQNVDELAGTWSGIPGALLKDTINNEKTNGASAKLVYKGQSNTIVLGTDYTYGNAHSNVHSGQGLILWYGADEFFTSNKSVTKWAVYANDTITIGDFSITPGIRHDYSSISGNFLSPSIGATYRAARNTVFRASIAKGFNAPSFGASASGGLFTDPNPDLINEKIWSYQAGLETWAFSYLKARVNIFHHDVENDLVRTLIPGSNAKYFNMDRSKRDGFEIDVETAPVYNISVRTGYGFVHKRTYYAEDTSTDMYMFNIALRYDDLHSLYAELDGHYIWWDLDATNLPEYDTFLWDLNMNKRFDSGNGVNTKVFLTVHNIFKASQYIYYQKKNPSRWLEAGLKVEF